MHGHTFGGPIQWRMHIPVPPAEVYAVLDSDTGRASFWAQSAIERNGAIEFLFANGYSMTSRILERTSPSRWSLEYFGSPVHFELKADGSGGTDLMVTHEGVQSEDWIDTHAGWLNVLFPLKVWLLHRVDIRNRDPKRTWDQGYADQ